MNVVAMKVGKSRLIQGLIVGNALVLNCTETPSYLTFPYLVDIACFDIEEGIDYFKKYSDLAEVEVDKYDTVIFYTYEKWENIRTRAYGIKSFLQDKNVVFMVNEL